MSNGRYVHQASEKISAICRALHVAGVLDKADMKALAALMGLNYSRFRSAVSTSRFSPAIEAALSKAARFDTGQCCWVDESVSEVDRRAARSGSYRGEDTIDRFRAMIDGIWAGDRSVYRSVQRSYSAFDPHMTRHDLSDAGQASTGGVPMQMFVGMHFEPFHHHSGVSFGFRKAVLTVDVFGGHDVHVSDRLGHPDPVRIRNAALRGSQFDRSVRWVLEAAEDEACILDGEYSSVDRPLFAIQNVEDGTAIASKIEVNLYDRTTCVTHGMPELSGNKQALIEQIFSMELASTEAKRGWVTLSRQDTVVARYEQ